MVSINIFAVIVALIVYTILGMLWYGPLFGKTWMALKGLSESDMKSPESKQAEIAGYISSLLSGLIALLTTAYLIDLAGVTGALPGLLFGALLGFGLIAMTMVGEAAWNSTPWALVTINAGYRIIGLALGGLMIGVW